MLALYARRAAKIGIEDRLAMTTEDHVTDHLANFRSIGVGVVQTLNRNTLHDRVAIATSRNFG